jgi:hypothetical protein
VLAVDPVACGLVLMRLLDVKEIAQAHLGNERAILSQNAMRCLCLDYRYGALEAIQKCVVDEFR